MLWSPFSVVRTKSFADYCRSQEGYRYRSRVRCLLTKSALACYMCLVPLWYSDSSVLGSSSAVVSQRPEADQSFLRVDYVLQHSLVKPNVHLSRQVLGVSWSFVLGRQSYTRRIREFLEPWDARDGGGAYPWRSVIFLVGELPDNPPFGGLFANSNTVPSPRVGLSPQPSGSPVPRTTSR
ncbi:hypothetical protein C8F01DRAFT_1183810 [Mycena amicta]|nr:hypothetical protein C8F01DRAFT_1183810 [Mycena amicta]